MIRTDNGHKFQSKFHWHCEDLGFEYVYIRPASPNLNGRSFTTITDHAVA